MTLHSLKMQLVSNGNAPSSGHHCFGKVNRTAEKISSVIQGHASKPGNVQFKNSAKLVAVSETDVL